MNDTERVRRNEGCIVAVLIWFVAMMGFLAAMAFGAVRS